MRESYLYKGKSTIDGSTKRGPVSIGKGGGTVIEGHPVMHECQYTTQDDCNGKPIYEADILTHWDSMYTMEVVWNRVGFILLPIKGYYSYELDSWCYASGTRIESHEMRHFLSLNWADLEVIGNKRGVI